MQTQRRPWLAVRRGDVYYADLRPVVGSEQSGVRPVLILQNNVGNQHSPTVIAAPITSRQTKARLPTHVAVGSSVPRLHPSSIVLLEQLRTLDKRRLREQIGTLDAEGMRRIDEALEISVGLALSYK